MISSATQADVGEIFTLQRAAYVSEALLYDNVELPPLLQTYDELATELRSGIGLKATVGHRIVGSGRAHSAGPVLTIERLIVAPDMQGRGLGTKLLTALEQRAPAEVTRYALFTGHLSRRNLQLYQRLGYTETRRKQLRPGVILVYLEKPA